MYRRKEKEKRNYCHELDLAEYRNHHVIWSKIINDFIIWILHNQISMIQMVDIRIIESTIQMPLMIVIHRINPIFKYRHRLSIAPHANGNTLLHTGIYLIN